MQPQGGAAADPPSATHTLFVISDSYVLSSEALDFLLHAGCLFACGRNFATTEAVGKR